MHLLAPRAGVENIKPIKGIQERSNLRYAFYGSILKQPKRYLLIIFLV